MTKSDPRLAVLRDFTRGDRNDLWWLALLEKIDAVDPLRQPVSMDAVEAALNSWWPNHGDRDWANGPRDDRLWYEKMSRALAAADAARGRDAEVNAPAWTAAKERALRQLVFLQPRATATDAERQLWSEIRREAFPEKSDE